MKHLGAAAAAPHSAAPRDTRAAARPRDGTGAPGTAVAPSLRVTLPRLRTDAPPEYERLQRSRSLLLLDQARIQAWQRLLFVECGDGWIVEEAWRRARRGYACGVDTSAALVARATALRGVPGALEFKTWDGSRLSFPTAFFQAVMATLPWDQCADASAALGEMYRVLQPGGDIYLLSPPDLAASLVATLRSVGFQEAGELTRCAVDLAGGEYPTWAITHARAAPPPDTCGRA